MPSTVRNLFAAAGLTPTSPVRWGIAPRLGQPGVYVIATTADPDEPAGLSTAPIATTAVADLLAARPELTWRGAFHIWALYGPRWPVFQVLSGRCGRMSA